MSPTPAPNPLLLNWKPLSHHPFLFPLLTQDGVMPCSLIWPEETWRETFCAGGEMLYAKRVTTLATDAANAPPAWFPECCLQQMPPARCLPAAGGFPPMPNFHSGPTELPVLRGTQQSQDLRARPPCPVPPPQNQGITEHED